MAVINKTYRYCPGCDLLIAHEEELRALSNGLFSQLEPEAVGREFLVVGTLERAAWRQGTVKPLQQVETLAALHDFREYMNYELTGGWHRDETSRTPIQPR